MKIKKQITYILTSVVLSAPTIALAYDYPDITPITSTVTEASAETSIGTVIDWLLGIAGVLTVLVIIIAGILYVVSVGNADRMKRAKQTLIYAVVGLVVIILSFWIVKFV